MEDGRGRRLEEQLQERPPESSVHPPRADRTWSLVSAPGSRHRVAGHAANMASRICTWGGVHRTVLRAQPFPVGLQGGGGLSAPLSVQEKGEQRSPSTQEWGPRAPALTSPQGAPRPTSPGPEAISPDCSTAGPLKYAPRLHLRSLYTLWRSGLRAGDQPRRGAASAWRARPSPPVSLSCALACPACSRHAGLWVLWPLAGLLVLGPRSQPARSPTESAPRGRVGVPRGQHREKQAPGLSFNSSSGKWGQCPCCEEFQRTTATKQPAHTHCVGAGARAGAPESQAGGWAAPAAPADSRFPARSCCGNPEASAADPNVTPHVSGSQLPSSGAVDTKVTKPTPTGANTSSSKLKQARVREALCLPPCGSRKIASQGVVLNQGLLRPGRKGLEPGAHPPGPLASWASRPPGTLHSHHAPGASREAVSEQAEGPEGRLQRDLTLTNSRVRQASWEARLCPPGR